MKRNKIYLKYQKDRAILSDVLPYEIPITFSNRFYYEFLLKYKIKYIGSNIEWQTDDEPLNQIIRTLFGVGQNVPIKTTKRVELGKELRFSTFETSANKNPENWSFVSIPFSYKISHKEKDHRELAICHPRNQLQLIDLYQEFKELILYYCAESPFSIRRPCQISKFIFHRDKTHYQRLSKEKSTIEEFTREYENLKSFFVYKEYSNIYKFYESYKFHRCEQKYNALLKLDISKCFDSIYTHSLAWALIGKEVVKENLGALKNTFADRFDILMQCLNYNETNGIIIGPEFSRLFAELILQHIDKVISNQLKEFNLVNKMHYQIFRYVDDYFIFYNEENEKERIQECIQVNLRKYKLSFNWAKSENYRKPIITEISIAKLKVAELLDATLEYRFKEKELNGEKGNAEQKEEIDMDKKGSIYINSNKLITKFKMVIKESNVEYKDMQNYTLSVVERKSCKIISEFQRAVPDDKENKESQLVQAILNILDFSFFIYSVTPRVNTTIKLCRIIKIFCDFLKRDNANIDLRYLVFKTINDKTLDIFKKNRIREHTQIETLYLLLSLNELGKEFWLEEEVLCGYFGIDKDDWRKHSLNYFSLTVLLFYIQKKDRYKELRAFLEKQICQKFDREKTFLKKDTELILLFFDMLSCPYITDATKRTLLKKYDITNRKIQDDVIRKRKFWFTKWTEFDFAKELDAKKSSEVY